MTMAVVVVGAIMMARVAMVGDNLGKDGGGDGVSTNGVVVVMAMVVAMVGDNLGYDDGGGAGVSIGAVVTAVVVVVVVEAEWV